MRLWLRRVWPPWFYHSLFGVIYLPLMGFILFEESRAGQRLPEAALIISMFLGFTAALYGGYRVLAFHPVFRQDYYQWLATTPWKRDKPLPLGPVHMLPQDLLLVGVLCVLAVPASVGWYALITLYIFMFFYLGFLVFALFLTREKWSAYLATFGIGLSLGLADHPVWLLAAVMVTYAIALYGILRTFACFPWELPNWVKSTRGSKETQALPIAAELGWPFAQLGPAPILEFPLRPIDALIVSGLVGWFLFTLSQHAVAHPGKDSWNDSVLLFGMLLGSIGTLVRAARYIGGFRPPISLAGRIGIGQWIQPGYDKVFAATALGWMAPLTVVVFQLWRLPERHIIEAFVAVWFVFCHIGLGPTLKSWSLTSNHRIANLCSANQFVSTR